MEQVIELLLETTDPVTAILLMVLIMHVRKIEAKFDEKIERVRSRVERLEDPHIPDSYNFEFAESGRGDADRDHDRDADHDTHTDHDRPVDE